MHTEESWWLEMDDEERGRILERLRRLQESLGPLREVAEGEEPLFDPGAWDEEGS